MYFAVCTMTSAVLLSDGDDAAADDGHPADHHTATRTQTGEEQVPAV